MCSSSGGQNCITQPLVSSHLQVAVWCTGCESPLSTSTGWIPCIPTSWGWVWFHHTYRCDDTRGCVMQFWPPDDGHMCSKHAEAWNKLIVKQKFCASSWLITEINKLCALVGQINNLILSTCMVQLQTRHSHLISIFMMGGKMYNELLKQISWSWITAWRRKLVWNNFCAQCSEFRYAVQSLCSWWMGQIKLT